MEDGVYVFSTHLSPTNLTVTFIICYKHRLPFFSDELVISVVCNSNVSLAVYIPR